MANWDEFSDKLDEDTRKCVNSEAQYVWIKGSAGSGKSVALYYRALRFLTKGKRVLWIAGGTESFADYMGSITRGMLEYKIHGQLFLNRKKEAIEEITGPDGNGFQHILIDEAPDLTLEELQHFITAVPEEGSFTIVATSAQSIWRDRQWVREGNEFIDLLGKQFQVFTLKNQYRMSKEILDLGRYIQEEELQLKSDIPDNAGIPLNQKPMLIKCNNREDEIKYICEDLKYKTDRSACVLITKKTSIRENERYIYKKLKTEFPERVTDVRRGGSEKLRSPIYYMSVAQAKGLEFDEVYIFLDNEYFYRGPDFIGFEKSLYVAVTRARSMVTMLCDISDVNNNRYLRRYYDKPAFDDLPDYIEVEVWSGN